MSRKGYLRLSLFVVLVGAGAALCVHVYQDTRPEARLRRGREALGRKDWRGAERLARQLETSGRRDEAWLLRGESFFRQEDYAAAVQELNQVEHRGSLGRQAAALSGQALLYLHAYREAEQALRFVLAEEPDHIDAHRALAAIYHEQGASLLALEHLKKVAALDSSDGRPHRFMGFILKDFPAARAEAVESYETALKRTLAPHVAEEVRLELAGCLVELSIYRRALEVLQQCGAETAATPKARALRAECLWSLGRTAEANEVLDKALADSPQSLEALRVKSKMLVANDDAKAAAPLLERILAAEPYDCASRTRLAQAYELLNRSGDAEIQRALCKQTQDTLNELTELNKEVRSRPWDRSLHRRLAETCGKLGRHDLERMWSRAAQAGGN